MYGIYVIAIVFAGLATVFGINTLILRVLSNTDGAKVNFFVFVVSISLALTFAVCGVATLKVAEEEYEQFLATQDVFEQVYVAENELENIKLTETIIEMNHWLVEAKASKKTYGCFSRYYYLNVEDLEPIGKR